MQKGHSFKDAICPDSLEFKKDHFVMGEKFGRVLFLKEYASYIKDSMINELTALNRTMMLSIDIISVPTDEAVREMQNRLLGVETNVTNWQRRQNNNNSIKRSTMSFPFFPISGAIIKCITAPAIRNITER